MQKINQKRSIFPLFLYICPAPVAIKDQVMQDGTTIHQWQFHGSATSRWEFDLTGDGYYTIRSMHSNATNYYLAVENDSTANGASIVLKSGEITDGMKWDIVRQTDGSVQLYSMVRDYGRALSVEYTTTQTQKDLGLDIKSLGTTANDYRTDEWFLRNLDDTIEDDLLNWELISSDDIVSTDDGFHMMLEPLSDVLIQRGITQVYYDNDDGVQHALQVSQYYDDWYIFAVNNYSTVKYGLVKMREEERDGGDHDTAGVGLPFLPLDVEFLKSCFLDYDISKGYELCDFLNSITTKQYDENGYVIVYDNSIRAYFGSAYSKGAYLIAEEYIKKVVGTHDIYNRIRVPKSYIELLSSLDYRLEYFVSGVDPNGEICVITDGNEYIQLADPNNLTPEETYIILALYTGDVSFNCFAAEVVYHAVMTKYSYQVSNLVYTKAFRADMTTKEDLLNGFVDCYHDEYNPIVLMQRSIHGER